jgi:manganese/zinc/iron transport system permease protein
MNFWDFFTDPILRGPTWGTLLMCIASSLMGVCLLLKRQTLLGESLSHAAYPGVVIGVSFAALFLPETQTWASIAVLLGALATAFLGLKAIQWLEKKRKVRSDAALCFVLAVFFGVGTLAASAMQQTLPAAHKHVQTLLFGQAATMSDFHIVLYAALALFVSLFIALSFRPLQAALFDRDFAKSSGLPLKWIERALFWLLLLSLIVGIRSVGVVLMSGMVLTPAIAARQFSDRLHIVFFLAALFGALSGLFGNLSSVLGSIALSTSNASLTLPTGPMIILAGASLALLSLAFAPKRGWAFRLSRIAAFRFRCIEENILKTIWRKEKILKSDLKNILRISPLFFELALWRMRRGGWLEKDSRILSLTGDGRQKGASVVRLHRLWELYLSSSLGFAKEKIHHNAEEMEHILTPDLEERLTQLLSNPKVDPHSQPIPKRRGVL